MSMMWILYMHKINELALRLSYPVVYVLVSGVQIQCSILGPQTHSYST